MVLHPPSIQSRRRTGRRYVALVLVMLALIGGWSWFWSFAAGRAQTVIDGWRAREAQSGWIYDCGKQSLGGYPFRIEVDCDRASAVFRNGAAPLEVKLDRILVAAQVYDPTLLIGEFTGPLTVADPGQPPKFTASWKLAQSSLRGTPRAPERASLVFDQPVVDRLDGATRQNLLRAQRIELHGRLAGGSVTANPVIEAVVRATQAAAPDLHPAAALPVDAEARATLRGLKDFTPKPWAARFREIQQADGRIEISDLRVKQGETLAVGSGTLSLNAAGRLQGELRVTVAGLEPFLKAIGAEQIVKRSQPMDKLAGALNRIAPGLGDVARQQASANIATGINLLGEPATLEGRNAITLPLRFDNGAVFLGPIPVGVTPALF